MNRKFDFKTSAVSIGLCLTLLLSANTMSFSAYGAELEESEDASAVSSTSEWLYEEVEEEDFPEINVFTGETAVTDTAEDGSAEDSGDDGYIEHSLPVDEFMKPEEEVPEAIEGEIEVPTAAQMRARASRPTLLKNGADYFYYYTKLSKEEKKIYNGLYQIYLYPDSTEKGAPIYVSAHPASQEFQDQFTNARFALLYDHPEFYFAYQHVSFDGVWYYYSNVREKDDMYRVQFQIKEPYKNAQKEFSAFNKAVNKFMNSLDLSQSDANIALQIHDKLLQTCSYNYDALNKGPTYARTAYSALVTHDPVCSGYSFAFTYLMQQAGLKAIVVSGDAGSDKKDASGHMWNMVKIGGMWYEIDVTWDDFEPEKDGWYSYQAGASLANDAAAMAKTTHYLFMVPTSYLNNFKYANNFKYTLYNGSWFVPMGNSVHIRDSADEIPVIASKAPKSYGKYYMQGTNCQKNFVVDDLIEDGQVFDDSNSRYLTKSDLKKLKKNRYYNADQLCRMARAEMYARRGFQYKNKYFKKFYSNYKWYKPKFTETADARAKFNKYEEHNYKLIKQFEKDNGYAWEP